MTTPNPKENSVERLAHDLWLCLGGPFTNYEDFLKSAQFLIDSGVILKSEALEYVELCECDKGILNCGRQDNEGHKWEKGEDCHTCQGRGLILKGDT